MQILTIILAIITNINALSQSDQRLTRMEQLAKEYYIGDIFQNIEIDIEYPKVLIFKGGYDKQQIKNETRNIVNERLKSMTRKALAKSFGKLAKRETKSRSSRDSEQDEGDDSHKRSERNGKLLDFFNYFFENFDVDFVPEAVYY